MEKLSTVAKLCCQLFSSLESPLTPNHLKIHFICLNKIYIFKLNLLICGKSYWKLQLIINSEPLLQK